MVLKYSASEKADLREGFLTSRDGKCGDNEYCLTSLMQPIAPTYREASEGNHTDLCYNVSNTMSHLLWGPEWADTTPMTGKDEKKRAEWQPIWFETDYPYIPTNEEEWEKERLPCEKEDMKKYCNIRAEQLCDIAFGDLGNQGTNDPTKNTTNFHRFSPKDHLNSEDTNSPIFIILALFFFSFLYAGKVHKDHTDRVKARQKRQLEESVSTRHVGSGSQVTPDGEVDMERMMSLEERNNKFFDLMTKKNDKDSTSMAGTIRPWDINFEEQEMEDMYRRMQLGENLLQFRWLLLLGLMVVIGYQLMLTSSRVVIQWELRGLLVFYCTLIIPFTFEATFVKYFAMADIMFSNSMVVISFVFIFISYLDKFKGTPTESFLMMGIVIGLNLTIMFVTGTVWFRKALVTLMVCFLYTTVALLSIRDCLAFDQFLNGEEDTGVQIADHNFYPSIQIVPDYDSFKYNMSCSQRTEDFNFIKQNMFVYVTSSIMWYTTYYQEFFKRQEFGRRWALLKNKLEMEKKIKQFQEKSNQSVKKKEALFGEIRELKFKTPLEKINETIEKIKIAVGDDRPVLDALSIIEDTLKEGDLNKVDIHKAEGLDQSDREIAKFILSAGGANKGSRERERVRSVPNLAAVFDGEITRLSLLSEVGHPPKLVHQTEAQALILDALEKYEDWDFDTNYFNFITEGNPMYYLFMKHMDRFTSTLILDVDALRLFVLYAEEHYCFDSDIANPYHTNLHSADVLQTVGVIMKTDFIQSKLGSLEKFTTLVASMMHDYRHKGVNNSFLVNSNDELALVHNDSSVLERFHASEMFLLLNHAKVDMDFTKNLNADDYRQFRNVSISMILATDLSQGYSYISTFKAKAASEKWGDTKEDIALLMQMVLKVADVSHPSKTLNSHLLWSVMITEEFFYQGDVEKSKGMAISPLCDRVNNFDIPKSQKGFIDFVVSPTMKPVAELLGLSVILDNLKNNYRYWSELHKEYTSNNTLEESFPLLNKDVEALKKGWSKPARVEA